MTYLDTHSALWLCTGDVALSSSALHLIDTDDLRVSPIVLLEMRFLQEIGRLNIGPDKWLIILLREFGVAVCGLPFHRVIEASFDVTWTRDPFDRIIVAQAIAGNGSLITKDGTILSNFGGAIW